MSSQRRRDRSAQAIGPCNCCPGNPIGIGLALAIALPLLGGAPAIAATLTNGAGDGQVSINVDGYGAFGADTLFNPTGPFGPTSVVTNSGLAIRLGSSGPRTFLSTGAIGSSGSLPVVSQTGNGTESRSSFVFGNLNFRLVQSVASGGVIPSTTGSRLTQTYTITNPTTAAISFDLLRYLDGALPFDSDADGGVIGTRLGTGRITLFESDVAVDFVGEVFDGSVVSLAVENSNPPGAANFEIGAVPARLVDIVAGKPLSNGIFRGVNFSVPSRQGYDVFLAEELSFTLDPGASTTYSTTTFFSGTPKSSPGPRSTPEAGLGWMGGLLLGLLALGSKSNSRARYQ